MLNETEIKRLRKWIMKFFELNNLDFSTFDFDNEIDEKLTYEENKTQLRIKIRDFLNIWNEQQIVKMKKKEVEFMPKEQVEIMTTELKKKEEKQAQLEFYNSLDKITEQKSSELLEQKFFVLREYIKMVCNGNVNGLIVEGFAGLGKSFNILKTLKESDKEFVYCSGFSTKLELFNFLYENRNKIIFFDDIKSILKDSESLEILKSALYSPTGTRIIKYMSSTNRGLKSPNSFIFKSGIIIALNNFNKANEDLKAVVDRVLYFNVHFSYKEKLQILADLIKEDYKDLSYDDRKLIFEWIKNNTNEATININFRLLYKLFEIFRHNKECFDRLAKEIVRKDEQMEIILTLLKESNTIKQAEDRFINEGYGCRTLFYKVKKNISF